MKRFCLFCLSVLALSACTDARDRLGLNRSAPDEFKVVKNAPLEMPDTLTLPLPRSGAPRPQEKSIDKQVKDALFGSSHPPQNSGRVGRSEAALLQKAGSDKAASDIRVQVDSDYAHRGENTSVAKRLLGIGGDIRGGNDVLDAEAEAKRLKEQMK